MVSKTAGAERGRENRELVLLMAGRGLDVWSRLTLLSLALPAVAPLKLTMNAPELAARRQINDHKTPTGNNTTVTTTTLTRPSSNEDLSCTAFFFFTFQTDVPFLGVFRLFGHGGKTGPSDAGPRFPVPARHSCGHSKGCRYATLFDVFIRRCHVKLAQGRGRAWRS